ncbi:MAG: EAL domain-containing protein, partial [Acidobacteriota bacterium]|nr:EAL domain-containing protein [Acidobacteriota bacterium]
REGVITAVNLAAEKLTGYLREEMVGQMVITALHDEKELRERALKGRSMRLLEADGVELLTARAAGGEMDEMELTYLRKDGTRIPVNLAMRAVTTASGSVSGFVVVAFDITERRRMLDHITYMATHDALTGLVVRSVLQEHTAEAVERSRRWGTKVAAFLIDLDQLKRINDQLGHQKGDRVIAEIAHRLQRGVRSSDIVGRLGGDKFAVVMTDITNARDVEQCAQHLVQCMAPAITVDEHEIYITGSIGVCTYPDYATDAVHLLRRASLAMNAAKENGRNQFMVFNESMLRETADRLSLEHALRHALPNGELSLAYQPQVSLSSGAVIGMEALLRWHHPKFGQVPPSQFIPLAEEAGIILPIGEWVFQRACMEGMEMRRQVGTDLIISVNLSPRQFQQSNLVQVIAAALQTSGLPAASLEIEITESILMVNSESNRDTLQRIRDLGVRIAIDDFGTGFSSFSYLLQYRVDRLKIDASFIHKSVDDTNAATIVRTIIAMSHSLNIAVIAEGVENEEQLRFLLRRRCDEAQGRYFSGPVSALEFEASVLNLNDQPISLSH